MAMDLSLEELKALLDEKQKQTDLFDDTAVESSPSSPHEPETGSSPSKSSPSNLLDQSTNSKLEVSQKAHEKTQAASMRLSLLPHPMNQLVGSMDAFQTRKVKGAKFGKGGNKGIQTQERKLSKAIMRKVLIGMNHRLRIGENDEHGSARTKWLFSVLEAKFPDTVEW
jgi:hypothetical protein